MIDVQFTIIVGKFDVLGVNYVNYTGNINKKFKDFMPLLFVECVIVHDV